MGTITVSTGNTLKVNFGWFLVDQVLVDIGGEGELQEDSFSGNSRGKIRSGLVTSSSSKLGPALQKP